MLSIFDPLAGLALYIMRSTTRAVIFCLSIDYNVSVYPPGKVYKNSNHVYSLIRVGLKYRQQEMKLQLNT